MCRCRGAPGARSRRSSATVSSATKAELDRPSESHGLKKNCVVELARPGLQVEGPRARGPDRGPAARIGPWPAPPVDADRRASPASGRRSGPSAREPTRGTRRPETGGLGRPRRSDPRGAFSCGVSRIAWSRFFGSLRRPAPVQASAPRGHGHRDGAGSALQSGSLLSGRCAGSLGDGVPCAPHGSRADAYGQDLDRLPVRPQPRVVRGVDFTRPARTQGAQDVVAGARRIAGGSGAWRWTFRVEKLPGLAFGARSRAQTSPPLDACVQRSITREGAYGASNTTPHVGVREGAAATCADPSARAGSVSQGPRQPGVLWHDAPPRGAPVPR